jgi:hypothetical protein
MINMLFEVKAEMKSNSTANPARFRREAKDTALSPQTSCAESGFVYLVQILSYSRDLKPRVIAICTYCPSEDRVQITADHPNVVRMLEEGILALGGERLLKPTDKLEYLQNLKYDYSGSMLRATDVITREDQRG